jgi:hypothetical protein
MMACLARVGQAQAQRWLFATERCDGVSVMWASLVRIVAIRRSVLPVAGVDVDIGGLTCPLQPYQSFGERPRGW